MCPAYGAGEVPCLGGARCLVRLQEQSRALGDGDFGAKVDVLDGVEELDAFLHGALERLAAGDEAGAAGALVDHGGGYRFFEVVGARRSAAIDQACAAHVAVGHLVARQVDGMVAAEIGVDALVEFAVAGIADVKRRIAAVIFRKLLLDDVRLDGYAEMVGLAGEVGGEVIVLVLLESVVTEIAPEDGGHAELVGLREGLADFHDLAAALLGAEIDGSADGGCAHIVGLLHGAKENLIGLVRVGQQLIVIYLYDEGDFVSVFARDGAEHTEGRSDGVAAALDGQLDDVSAIKIIGIFGEAGATGVFDALVDGQYREIARAAESAGADHALQICEHAQVAVRRGVDAVDKVRAGKMQALLGDLRRLESQQGIRLCAEIGFNFSLDRAGCHFFLLVSGATAKRSIQV